MTHRRKADILSFPTRVRPPLNYYPITFIHSLGATTKKRVLQGTVVLCTQYPARVIKMGISQPPRIKKNSTEPNARSAATAKNHIIATRLGFHRMRLPAHLFRQMPRPDGAHTKPYSPIRIRSSHLGVRRTYAHLWLQPTSDCSCRI